LRCNQKDGRAMFKKLAKSGFAKFSPAEPRRIVQGLHEVALSDGTYANDNLPGFRRGSGHAPVSSPALTLSLARAQRPAGMPLAGEAQWRRNDWRFDELSATGRPAIGPRAVARLSQNNANECKPILRFLQLRMICNNILAYGSRLCNGTCVFRPGKQHRTGLRDCSLVFLLVAASRQI
jgi:hypothetical protein